MELRLTPADVQRAVDAVFAEAPRDTALHVFAVLDGARCDNVRKLLARPRVRSVSLYAGHPPREVAEIAPRLIRMQPDSAALATVLGDGWGRSWGLFIATRSSIEALRKHLRRLLTVETEGGRRLFFRWYDPRVLRAYLPTCRPDEVSQVFGRDIHAFTVESEDGRSLLRFTRKSDGTLEQAVTPVRCDDAVTEPASPQG